MTVIVQLAMVAAMLGSPQTPPAPQQPPQGPEVRVDDIVVEGRRLQTAVSGFIGEVAAPARGEGLAVWDRRVCVGTANFRPEHATYLIDRVSQVAAVVGLEPGESGCRPDILVIATRDATAFATGLVEANAQAFRPALSGTDGGREALRAFQRTDRAVRWWPISLPVNSDTGQVATRLIGDEDAPEVTVRSGSRLSTDIRQVLKRVIIIVDVDKLGTTNFAQISDYIAMVALAQIDPNADTRSYDTVLNAFSGEAPRGLTQWDLDYLTALYTAPSDRRNPRHQAEALADRMVATGAARSQED